MFSVAFRYEALRREHDSVWDITLEPDEINNQMFLRAQRRRWREQEMNVNYEILRLARLADERYVDERFTMFERRLT